MSRFEMVNQEIEKRRLQNEKDLAFKKAARLQDFNNLVDSIEVIDRRRGRPARAQAYNRYLKGEYTISMHKVSLELMRMLKTNGRGTGELAKAIGISKVQYTSYKDEHYTSPLPGDAEKLIKFFGLMILEKPEKKQK